MIAGRIAAHELKGCIVPHEKVLIDDDRSILSEERNSTFKVPMLHVSRYCVSMFDCDMFFYSLKLNLTVSNVDLVTLQRISENVKEVSRS